MKGDIGYFKVWYRFSGWEYYKKDFECYFWSPQVKAWHGCGEPSIERQVIVSPLEIVIVCGPEVVK
jgi:hypothetical protein